MPITIDAVVEYNDLGSLMQSTNFIGAYARGATIGEALDKFPQEITRYVMWLSGTQLSTSEKYEINIVQEKRSGLQICDADSDILFDTERPLLGIDEYEALKSLALKSAADFNLLYNSIPDSRRTNKKQRRTFYGDVPRTAEEMYVHTNNVSSYYTQEIGVMLSNMPNIFENRLNAMKNIEQTPGFLDNKLFDGSYEEQWTLRKVLRRFIWHDRIHAKAMYTMAASIWDENCIADPFYFGLSI